MKAVTNLLRRDGEGELPAVALGRLQRAVLVRLRVVRVVPHPQADGVRVGRARDPAADVGPRKFDFLVVEDGDIAVLGLFERQLGTRRRQESHDDGRQDQDTPAAMASQRIFRFSMARFRSTFLRSRAAFWLMAVRMEPGSLASSSKSTKVTSEFLASGTFCSTCRAAKYGLMSRRVGSERGPHRRSQSRVRNSRRVTAQPVPRGIST